VISTEDTDRFLSLLADAEAGAPDVLPRMRELVAASDSVAALLEENAEVAIRFAMVDDRL
jgi:hypothetical protein